MQEIHPRTHPVAHADLTGSAPLPWEDGHAAPEDQAVGLELELIELVTRRKALPGDDPACGALDAEIDETLTRLGSITPLETTG